MKSLSVCAKIRSNWMDLQVVLEINMVDEKVIDDVVIDLGSLQSKDPN